MQKVVSPHTRPGWVLEMDGSIESAPRTKGSMRSDKILIAGIHLGELGFAHVERIGKTYKISYET
ncbi:hypothetical protein [Pseudomonas sp. NIBRBAC000502773]|uniref:hypothetical protein n=1 Tax=Pseudomonas sp. NIBRBAC000502773 TaxID=2590776 RepID=UPI00211E74CC|nr:hypothetical protein [Pseudomonas sp. NIBRBAC000502773]